MPRFGHDGETESLESLRNRKKRRIDRVLKLQLVPLFCKLLFVVMIVLTMIGALSDLRNYILFGTKFGVKHLFFNLFLSAFSAWGAISAVLIPLSLYQLKRLANGYTEAWPEELNPADIADNKRYFESAFAAKAKRAAPEKKYRTYIAGAVLGSFTFGILLVIFAFV